MSFSENLKSARKSKGLTQQQLAELLNLDRSAVAYYEKGTAMPHARNIQKLCDILQIFKQKLFNHTWTTHYDTWTKSKRAKLSM